jgi:hypothetical protein
MYEISSVTDNDNVVLTADIRSGAPDPTDVVCAQGTGAIGATWATVQHALDNITRDATDGDQINVKAGTDDELSAGLDVTGTYGSPTVSAGLYIRGYTSAANDGGIGGIDCGGANGLMATANLTAIHLVDMHIHNSGANNLVDLGGSSSVQQCEINDCGATGIEVGSYSKVLSNHVHDVATYGISLASFSCAIANYLKNDGAEDFTAAIFCSGRPSTCRRNIISIDNGSHGIQVSNDGEQVSNNSIFSDGGSGTGIYCDSAAMQCLLIIDNLVEGFSDGGVGINYGNAVEHDAILGNNGIENCTTETSNASGEVANSLADESLGASPFAKSGADTFANRFTYFAPVDTGNVQGGAYPSGCRLDKGAVQHADPAGGGGGLVGMAMLGGRQK